MHRWKAKSMKYGMDPFPIQTPQLDFLDLLTVETTKESAEEGKHEEVFLPGVPSDLLRAYYSQAPGNEIETGKFRHPESSAALAGNTFGIFLKKPLDLPPIPGFERKWFPVTSVSLETTLQFPWHAGRHPCLDVFVTTESAVFAIESKRYEPFRERQPASFSNAYWRRVWGDCMDGYEFARDILSGCKTIFARLDAAQLVKHAFGLRTAVHSKPGLRGKMPILVYLYAQPSVWPDGRKIPQEHRDAHSKEIARFERCVAGSEVAFHPISYAELLGPWLSSDNGYIRDHAGRVRAHFFV
jgi:hypothetical protein